MLCVRKSNYLLFQGGLCLFKGLRLLFLTNVSGAMFIQGATSTRVAKVVADHDEGICKWVNSEQIFFWYQLLRTTYDPQ